MTQERFEDQVTMFLRCKKEANAIRAVDVCIVLQECLEKSLHAWSIVCDIKRSSQSSIDSGLLDTAG
jgi:hypothetical protein